MKDKKREELREVIFNSYEIMDTAGRGFENVWDWYEKNLQQAIQEGHNTIAVKLSHVGWHETGCPAHSINMQKESDCSCLLGFMVEAINDALYA